MKIKVEHKNKVIFHAQFKSMETSLHRSSTPCLKVHVVPQAVLIHLLADVSAKWKSTGSNNSCFILNCRNGIYGYKVFEVL